MLRPYQHRTITQLYDWFERNATGNPCVVLPTGSGKSHVIAHLCHDMLTTWPDTRVLMLTHQKELIEQNAEKLMTVWPDAPLGIYSASVGRKDLDQITFAGIQSVRKQAKAIGHVDIVMIDECFAAGTQVITPSGEVDIDKVRCGDTILTQSGFGIVDSVSCRPATETFKVELSNDRVIECTGNHPFFTDSGWTKARDLARGARLFSVENMSALWDSVSSLDGDQGRQSDKLHSRASLEKAEFLLGEVCKEIISDSNVGSGAQSDKQALKGDKAQAHSARRQRALAAFAAVGAASRAGRRMGGRDVYQDESGAPQRSVSERLQGRHWQSREDDCNRAGRIQSRDAGEERERPQEDRFFGQPWVVSVSRIQRESPIAVFNLQVSGHPSYFANGVAVHNCHLVSHHDTGSYRKLLSELKEINPALRVVGLTATPYRLGHGLITDEPAIFSALIEPTSVLDLVQANYLSPLRSKLTDHRYELDGLHKRGGDYIEKELAERVNTDGQNVEVVDEIINRGRDRRSWLIFCSGVDHSYAVASRLRDRGISAETITGETPKATRETLLRDFRAGRLRALTNANCLTTGVDVPGIDLIALLRPTASPGLYVQMVGRGMRLAEGKADCLVLDFAGAVKAHGPITDVRPPGKAGQGEAPLKSCPECNELLHLSVMQCTACGYEFPPPPKPKLSLHDDEIMRIAPFQMRVTDWRWDRHVSRTSGIEMLRISYYSGLTNDPVREYMPVRHEGYAGRKAVETVAILARSAGADVFEIDDLTELAQVLSRSTPPTIVEYKRDGKFHKVVRRIWNVTPSWNAA